MNKPQHLQMVSLTTPVLNQLPLLCQISELVRCIFQHDQKFWAACIVETVSG